jgi:hypothetical protein
MSPANGHGAKAHRDDALTLALARGLSNAEAAAEAGVSERTVGRRKAAPAFLARVRELRAGLVEWAAARLADGMVEAADTLGGLLTAESEATRLGAARSLIELGAKRRDSLELEERIAELERLARQHRTGEVGGGDDGG